MKYWIFTITILAISCNSLQEKKSDTLQETITIPSGTKNNDISWTGTINNKTPVFIHYQVNEKIVVGEITYLNTKNKQPIKLIGTIEEDKSYRLLEFDTTGNITGVITGLPTDKVFKGDWFSPKSRKDLSIELSRKDTLIGSQNIQAEQQDIFGSYHYQYSEAGYTGDFSVVKTDNERVAFDITSVTGEPARNIAEVAKDTIKLIGLNFIYKIPETDSCEFKVSFYKDFVYINYTKGYCAGQFGNNATIEGVFLKIK